MKIIFLDIDGVLVIGDDPKCLKSFVEIENHYLNPFAKECVESLNKLIEATGAKIVISSTWRKSNNIDILKKHFEGQGVVGEIIGTTPVLKIEGGFSVNRGLEIQCWIDKHDHENIESFVIIDDDSDMSHLMDKLVRTCLWDYNKDGTKTGLREKHVLKAISILNN